MVCLLKDLSDCPFGPRGFSALSDSRTQKGRDALSCSPGRSGRGRWERRSRTSGRPFLERSTIWMLKRRIEIFFYKVRTSKTKNNATPTPDTVQASLPRGCWYPVLKTFGPGYSSGWIHCDCLLHSVSLLWLWKTLSWWRVSLWIVDYWLRVSG